MTAAAFEAEREQRDEERRQTLLRYTPGRDSPGLVILVLVTSTAAFGGTIAGIFLVHNVNGARIGVAWGGVGLLHVVGWIAYSICRAKWPNPGNVPSNFCTTMMLWGLYIVILGGFVIYTSIANNPVTVAGVVLGGLSGALLVTYAVFLTCNRVPTLLMAH